MPGDADHRLYSKANTVIDKVGLHINGSNRDAIPLVKPNDATTGNKSDGQPTRRFYYKNITVPSGHIGIDIETETGRIKWSGPMSEFPAFMETRRATNNGTSELSNNRTVIAQEKAKTTGLDIEIGLAEIRKSLLQAIKDKDEAQVILSLENGADANSEDNWGPALTQAIRWENETVVMELIGRGADANATDNWGPALTQAIRWENETVVMELIGRGADANATDNWGPAITQAQSGGLAKTVKELLKQGALAPPKIQKSSRFGQTTIEGVFPTGTNLDISTPDGTRQIIASRQPIIACNVSAGSRSFQFIGDAVSLDTILRERRNMGC